MMTSIRIPTKTKQANAIISFSSIEADPKIDLFISISPPVLPTRIAARVRLEGKFITAILTLDVMRPMHCAYRSEFKSLLLIEVLLQWVVEMMTSRAHIRHLGERVVRHRIILALRQERLPAIWLNLWVLWRFIITIPIEEKAIYKINRPQN